MEWKASFHKQWTYEWTLLPSQVSREKIEKYKEKKKEETDIYVGDCLPGKHSRPL